MDKKSLIILLPFVAFFLAGFYNYQKIVVKEDYMVSVDVPCNPEKEACFKNNCIEAGGSDCLGKTIYFKVISKRAYNVPECYDKKDTDKTKCPPLICKKGEKDCVVEYCTEKARSGQKTCEAYF